MFNNLIIGYRLKHPNSNKHYVGITSKTCAKRLYRHLNVIEKNKKYNWIKSHDDEKHLFYMEPIFFVDNFETAKQLEKYWIAEDRKIFGHENIMNGTDGGDGTIGHIHSKETREKMSKSSTHHHKNLGFKHSEQSKINMGKSKIGHITTEETKSKLSIANSGKKLSEEHKIKLSEAKRGEKHPLYGKHHKLETREKMIKNHVGTTGYHHSPETRKKISDGNKGKVVSDEFRVKISLLKKGNKYWLGKKHSLKTREKMSKSKKGKPSQRKGTKLSEETKKKMSLSKMGIKKSLETINKISESKRKIKKDQIPKIFIMLKNGIKQKELSKIFNVDPSTISHIKSHYNHKQREVS